MMLLQTPEIKNWESYDSYRSHHDGWSKDIRRTIGGFMSGPILPSTMESRASQRELSLILSLKRLVHDATWLALLWLALFPLGRPCTPLSRSISLRLRHILCSPHNLHCFVILVILVLSFSTVLVFPTINTYCYVSTKCNPKQLQMTAHWQNPTSVPYVYLPIVSLISVVITLMVGRPPTMAAEELRISTQW